MTSRMDNVELLRRLVAFDSTSHRSNLPIADFICNYLDRPGIQTERFPNGDGTKANLLVRLGPEVTEERQGIILSGHLDVVPAEEEGWNSDPFELSEGDDRWTARGSADMKGFVALAVTAAAELDSPRLAAPLWLLFTYDEELGCLGAQQWVDQWPAERPLPSRALIGEPTRLRVVRLHKGHLRIRIELRGLAAHSAYPHRGRSAIEPAGRVITALAELRRELEAERAATSDLFPKVPFPTLNVGLVRAGSAVNAIPASCTLEVGIRLLPGQASQPIVDRVTQSIDNLLPDVPDVAGYSMQVLNDSPPLLTSDRADHYLWLCDRMKQGQTASGAFASDAGPLQRLGIESILWGPGDIEVAHRPNEFLPQTEFVRAEEILGEFIDRFCGTHE